MPHRARAARRAAMALWSKLSADEHGIILGQLCNTLEPRRAVYFSSVSSGLRLLLTPAMLQQLRTEHEVAAALCRKMRTPGTRSCKELREAKTVQWVDKRLSATDLATLGTLSSVLPELESLLIAEYSANGLDGVQRLAEGLGAGALPAVAFLAFVNLYVGGAGASSALAAALGRGALPRLRHLKLGRNAIRDAGLVALAPALRRMPALENLDLGSNPFGDEGLAALVAPLPPAGALPPTTGVLKKLKTLDLSYTEVSDAGCTALASALNSGALPALKALMLEGIPASAAAKAAVYEARDTLLEQEESDSEPDSESEED